LAFTGSIGSTDAHSHHANVVGRAGVIVQIVTATTALTVLDEDGARHAGTKVVVPADAPHRIEVGAMEGTVVFLEGIGRHAFFRGKPGWKVVARFAWSHDVYDPRRSFDELTWQ
jgi:hypothetical protein